MGSTQRDDTWSTLLQSVANTRDREAFQKLFEHFAPLVKGFCLSKPVAGQSSNLADEVVQEVMIKVWQKASSFDASKASASTWPPPPSSAFSQTPPPSRARSPASSS